MDIPATSDTSWVDLVDVHAGDQVLLLDAGRRRSEPHLRQCTGDLTVITGAAAGVLAVVAPEGGWDLVCLDGVDVTQIPQHWWASVLAPLGRVVVVGDHLASPLRMVDGVTRKNGGPGARLSHTGSVRSLSDAGLVTQQVFGLLRSSAEPVVAFDALAESSLPAVLGATLAHVHGWRGRVLAAATRLSAHHVLRLCPGWVVVAGATAAGLPDRVVGKVSNRDSLEVKLLRGDPVTSVERRYLDGFPTAEVEALRELEAAGFDLAPRVISPPSSTACRYSWLSGSPLPVDRLDKAQLEAWVGRAAEVLAGLQSSTLAEDGTVLVHGDYWLGNLLTSGERVSGVVDWTEAHRGSPETDQAFLVSSLERWITSGSQRRQLEEVRDAALGSP